MPKNWVIENVLIICWMPLAKARFNSWIIRYIKAITLAASYIIRISARRTRIIQRIYAFPSIIYPIYAKLLTSKPRSHLLWFRMCSNNTITRLNISIHRARKSIPFRYFLNWPFSFLNYTIHIYITLYISCSVVNSEFFPCCWQRGTIRSPILISY